MAPTNAVPEAAGVITTFSGTPLRTTFPLTKRHLFLIDGAAVIVIFTVIYEALSDQSAK